MDRTHRGRAASLAPLLAIGALLLATAALPLAAQTALVAGDATLSALVPTPSTISATSPAPVESIFVAIQHDPAVIVAVAVEPLGAAIAAEGFFTNLIASAGGVVVGIIADVAPPFAGQDLPPLAAEAVIAIHWSAALLVASPQTTAIEFVDGVFDNPPVTNTIVQAGGIAVTQAQGLVLDGGTVTLLPPAAPSFRIEPLTLDPDEIGEIAVTLDNPTGAIGAYGVAVPRPAGLEFLAIITDGTIVETLAAELVLPELAPEGAALQVVLDSDPPFAGQTIPLGAAIPILGIAARVEDPPLGPDPAEVFAVVPADGIVGSPPVANRVAIGAIEIDPVLVAGEVTALPVPLSPIVFLAGMADGGAIGPVSAAPGETVPFGFWYTDPVGGIQGVQLAVCVPCELSFVPNSFSGIGGTLDEAEFVLATYDNDPADGDGCEMTMGALLDSLPPFDGQTMPATADPLLLGTVQLAVSAAAIPFSTLPVEYCDFIGGAGAVPIENVAIVGGESIFNLTKIDGAVVLDAGTPFRRGDANADGAIDLADPITAISRILGLVPTLACPASADCDGNAALDLADPVLLLGHLYAGGPPPVAPYPDCAVAPGAECPSFGGCP